MAFVVTIRYPLGRPPSYTTVKSAMAARRLYLTTNEESTVCLEGSDEPLSMEELDALAEQEAKELYGG